MSNAVVSAKYRRGTQFKLDFPTLPSLKAIPRRVDLYQEAYSHDVMKVEFPKFSEMWFKLLKTGIPVKFTWTQNTTSNTWLGYVQGIKRKNVAGQRNSIMEVTFVGTSWVLKERATETFTNKTIPEVAALIAKKFKLNFVGDAHPRRYSHLALSGQSYWEWLHHNALKIGYGMYMDGVTLVFRPLDKLLDYVVNDAPVLTLTDNYLPMNSQIPDRTLDNLTVLSSEYNESGKHLRTNKLVGGVDPLTNQVYLSSKSPKTVGTNLRAASSDVLFNEYDTSHVANSATSITAAAEASAQLGRFNLPAQTYGQGDPRVHPFGPVLIQGTGDLTDGYWFVGKAHHLIHRVGDYQMELDVYTDGLGQNQVTAARSGTSTDGITIDLSQKILATPSNTIAPVIGAKLVTKYPILREADQGFIRTPSYWEVSYGGKAGCCN